MKKAIVTLCIGEDFQRMGQLTHPLMKEYAQKLKADFLVINYPIINNGDPGFEKFQLYTILKHYDRVIFLDTDIIVRKHCPNLFDIVPESDIGAFIESEYALYTPDVNHQERIVGIQNALGHIMWNKDYFNSGVVVLNKRHRSIFDLEHGQIIDLHDQTQLNYNVKKLGFWVHNIGIRLNKLDCINPGDRFEAFIIHYAGRGYTGVWNDAPLKIERIRKDLEIIEKEESL